MHFCLYRDCREPPPGLHERYVARFGEDLSLVLHRNAASFFQIELFANQTFYCLALLHDNHAWSHRQTMEPFEKIPHIKVWQIAAHKNYVKFL